VVETELIPDNAEHIVRVIGERLLKLDTVASWTAEFERIAGTTAPACWYPPRANQISKSYYGDYVRVTFEDGSTVDLYMGDEIRIQGPRRYTLTYQNADFGTMRIEVNEVVC
jgi:hypothetical protein